MLKEQRMKETTAELRRAQRFLSLRAPNAECFVLTNSTTAAARDVVVVGILATPNYTAGLVFLAGQGFELHLHESVFEVCTVLNAHRIRRLAGLSQDVRFAGCGVVGDDHPVGVAFAGLGGDPTW